MEQIPLLPWPFEKLGLKGVRNDRDLAATIEKRLPSSIVDALLRSGLTADEVYELIIPRRTLAHRVNKRLALSVEESDKAVRVARRSNSGTGIRRERARVALDAAGKAHFSRQDSHADAGNGGRRKACGRDAGAD
jgi:hypothetical protein